MSDGTGNPAYPSHGVPTSAGRPPKAAARRGQGSGRLLGVDVARGVAMIAMVVLHLLPPVSQAGTMSVPWRLSVWNAAALFALVSGVAMALTTGRAPVRGRAWAAASASMAVRALILGLVGLLLAYALPPENQRAIIILPFFAVLFLLATPLFPLSRRWLVALTPLLAIGVPLLSHVVRPGMQEAWLINPTFADVLSRPGQLTGELLLTGVYPALPYLGYVSAGLVIGRSALSSERVQLTIVGTGVALATLAGVVSGLLMAAGGLSAVRNDAAGVAWLEWMSDPLEDVLIWGAAGTLPTTSPWWLAVRAPNSATPFDLLFTIGVAMAILGVALLLADRVPRLLEVLAVFGKSTLTLYCLHLLLLAALGMVDLSGSAEFVLQIAILGAFAWLWGRRFERGPLEQVVASASGRVRRSLA